MELWIRSQDKGKLLKVKCLYINNTSEECFINAFDVGQIATYKTKERALEVLDEMHQRLIDLQTLEYLQGTTDIRWAKNRNISCVYEMPKE